MWEKSGLGPERSVACRTCEGRVGISLAWIICFLFFTSWLPLLLILLGLIFSDTLSLGRLLSGAVAIGAFSIGVLVQAILFRWVVPLAAR